MGVGDGRHQLVAVYGYGQLPPAPGPRGHHRQCGIPVRIQRYRWTAAGLDHDRRPVEVAHLLPQPASRLTSMRCADPGLRCGSAMLAHSGQSIQLPMRLPSEGSRHAIAVAAYPHPHSTLPSLHRPARSLCLRAARCLCLPRPPPAHSSSSHGRSATRRTRLPRPTV